MSTPTIKDLHQTGGSNVPAMLVNLAAFAVAIASLASGWPSGHPLWIAAITVWLAYFQHCWTTIFHEDAHYSLYKARWHNIFNGTIIGTLVMVPFNVYRQVHIRHHAKMNSPEDWELWPYTDPKTSLSFRRVFVCFDILLGVWVAPYIYGRIFWVRNSPLADPALRRRIALEYLLIAAFWGSIWGLVISTGAWYPFAVIYLIPAFLTGVFQTIRKLTEHLGLPEGNAMSGARTVLSHGWFGRALAWTSFHIDAHGLHHAFPQMPHVNLEQAYKSGDARTSGPVFSSYWRAMRDMLPHLARPGIGVNVQQ
jgi:fatty acid desaturase